MYSFFSASQKSKCIIQTEGYIQAILASQQVLFPLGDPKKKVENIIDNLSEYKKQCYLITWLSELRSNFTGGPRGPFSPAGPRKPLKG